MEQEEVRHLIVVIQDQKFRINYESDTKLLSEVVEETLIDFITYTENVTEPEAHSFIKAKKVAVKGIFNEANCMIKQKWTIKEGGLKSGEKLFIQLLDKQLQGKENPGFQETSSDAGKKLIRRPSWQDAEESSLALSESSQNLSLLANNSPEESTKATKVPSFTSSQGDSSTSEPSRTDFLQYSSEEILDCTGNFSEKQLIAKGGQSEVYRGILHGTEVAVKRYKEGQAQDMAREVEMSPRHPQVVLVLGYCAELACIVSEFMPGGSLQDRLTSRDEADEKGEKKGKTKGHLSLVECLQVGADVASALQHLHLSHISHGDLKPANVMLSSHVPLTRASGTQWGPLRAKLADLGMARHLDHSQTEWELQGTAGYMDPFYAERGRVSKTSDTYSLGLILLQVLTNEKDVKSIHECLARCPDNPRDLEMAMRHFLPKVMVQPDAISASCAEAALWLALQCVERSPRYRPGLDVLTRWFRTLLESLEGGRPLDLSAFKNQTKVVPTVEEWKGESRTAVRLSEEVLENFRSVSGISDIESPGKGKDISLAASVPARYVPTPSLADGTEFSQHTPEEQYLLGYNYEFGSGVMKDLEMAFYWYSQASASGHTSASVAVARFLLDGIGQTREEEEALERLQRGSDEGHMGASLRLAHCYFHGLGVKRNLDKAQMLAQSGLSGRELKRDNDPSYLYAAGLCLEGGIGTSQDKREAQKLFWEAAGWSYAPACLKIGMSLLAKDNASVDSQKEAVKFFLFAAADGLREAEFHLAQCYRDGYGTKKDFAEAVKLFRRAAKKGHAGAQAIMASCLAKGEGVEKSETKALYYYERAAVQGNCTAQYALGMCYKEGRGTSRDLKLALDWLGRACQQVNSVPSEQVKNAKEAETAFRQILDDLQYRAKCFSSTDYGIQAAGLLKSVAEKGFPSAQFSYGVCLSNGWGVCKDRLRALEFLRKAQNAGHKGASDKIKKLLGQKVKSNFGRAFSEPFLN